MLGLVLERRWRRHRSELAVPATSEHFFAKAAAGAADAIFIDLEDAVAPDTKEVGRANAIRAINDVDWRDKIVSVRVNGLDTQWALRDILEIVGRCPRLDLVIVPKTASAFDVQFVERILASIERERGGGKIVGITALVETALGVASVEQIVAASDRLEAVVFGGGDYSVSMQTFDAVIGASNPRYAMLTEPDEQGQRARHWNDPWHFALARIANACRAYGVRPIDGPYGNFRDPAGLKASVERAAALGFEGKWAIHPSQIEEINLSLTPNDAQIAWAREVLSALAAARAEGKGAIGKGGVLFDLAHERGAHQILRRARLQPECAT
jgi:malyl-CoA/(S)-citramalyl-CoA lyase